MTVALAGGAIVLIIAIMVAARTLPRGVRPASTPAAVNATLLHALANVPASVGESVGRGTAQGDPTPIGGPALLGPNHRPEVFYVGAEYCPYCAAERWPLIVALSRFGTFSGLQTSRSAADDVFPSTPTFTFLGSTYQSQYLDFVPLETQSNVKVGGRYATLQTPTPDQAALLARYNAPPYVPASEAGAIPFIDVANQYLISGASFSPGQLDNRSWEAIASGLGNPGSADAKAIVGTANLMTAAICKATADSPSEVCGQPAIQQIERTLPTAPASGR